MNIVLVLGARPQIVKSAPLINLARKEKQVNLSIIHTGQHYDYELTKIFFEDLQLPDPTANLNAGSGTHAEQTARIMFRLERTLQKQRPDLLIVPGDTNSTLAGALTGAKLHLPVGHIEAGARSYDMKMPEEINRRLTDHCSTLLFTPTENCTRNLLKEGIDRPRIYQTGDTMYDVLLQQMPKAERAEILQQLCLEPNSYALLTTHRSENVDNPQILENIVNAVMMLRPLTVVFPAHPRTLKQLRKSKLERKIQKANHIRLLKPLGYHETLKLIKNAKLILTDSGGMQKEAFWLGTPCITLRQNTEWPETLHPRANHLTGVDTKRIVETAREIVENQQRNEELGKLRNLFGDGNASERIIAAIKSYRTE